MSAMRKLILLSGFFIVTPFILGFSLLFYSYLAYQQNPLGSTAALFGPKQTVAFAALPTTQNIYHEEIVEKDARVELVRQFLARYGSPLEPNAQDIVSIADKYNMDYRLLPAIAMQESNLCKKIIKDSHNCWGFGIYGKKVTKFDNYPQAIEAVTKTLAKNYKAQGLETPDEIMTKYTPSSNGSWAYSVNHFMEQLQ